MRSNVIPESRSLRPEQHEYEAIFPAKITANSSSGGVYYHTWTEQEFDAATGAYSDVSACPRTGTLATEINNRQTTAGTYVWMRFKGMVGGDVAYEFLAPSSSSSSGLTVGTTAITGGTDTRILYDASGTLGEYPISGSGSVAMTTSPSLVTPTVGLSNATTNAVDPVLTLQHASSGTPAAGFGLSVPVQLQSSTTANRDAFVAQFLWATATDASRKARATLGVYDTAIRECIRMEASGSAPMLGFFGASASAQLSSPDVGTALTTFGFASGTPTFAAANLSGSSLPAGITGSSLTSVGTLTGGTWQGTAIGTAYGGTGNTTGAGVGGMASPTSNADQTTTSTTLADVPGLSVAVSASKKYLVKGYIRMTGTPSGGSRLAVNGPSGSCDINITWHTSATAFTTERITALNTSMLGTLSTISLQWVNIEGTFLCGGSGGNFTVQFKSVTGGNTTTVAGTSGLSLTLIG